MSLGELIESWNLNGKYYLFIIKIEYKPFYQSAGYQNIFMYKYMYTTYITLAGNKRLYNLLYIQDNDSYQGLDQCWFRDNLI